jgi:succinate-acetate transporter protein
MEAGAAGREPVRGEAARARSDPTAGPTAGVSRVLPITADPGPLGLGAFALTTFMLSMFNADLVSGKGLPAVLAVALASGGIAQLLAGMWEFRTGNTFGAVAFTSYGAFWLSFWALGQFYLKPGGIPLAHVPASLGLYLIAWGIFTLYMFIASLRVTAAVSAVFLALTVTYFLLGIGNAGSHTGLVKAGGWAGIVTAALAWYASFAAVTNETFGRTVLPVVPLRR